MSKDIKYVLILICKLPKELQEHQKTNSTIPAHINIAYLNNNINENDIYTKLSRYSSFSIRLDEVMADNNKVCISITRVSYINKICDKLKEFIERKPQNAYHLTLINSKTPWSIYKSEDICNDYNNKLSLPVDIIINEIWLIKKEKNRKKLWTIVKKIKLKEK